MAYTVLGDERIRVLMAEAREEPTALLPGTIIRAAAEGLDVACGDGVLRITQVQLPGKKAMRVADVINGQPQLFQPNHLLASTLRAHHCRPGTKVRTARSAPAAPPPWRWPAY